MLLFMIVDIGECGGVNRCHGNAACSSTVGSYACTCNPGFTGDGENCTGEEQATSNNYRVVFFAQVNGKYFQ